MRPESWEVFLWSVAIRSSRSSTSAQNPGDQLKSVIKNGTRLVVIDPRRTETARKAEVHLQCIPGEDPTIMAGLIHLIIANDWVNREFVAPNTQGFDQLASAVSRFTPDYVAERAGIEAEDLQKAARIIGQAKAGDFGSGTGPSMATRGTLTAYLMVCLQTLRGFWAAEGRRSCAAPRAVAAHQIQGPTAGALPGMGVRREAARARTSAIGCGPADRSAGGGDPHPGRGPGQGACSCTAVRC